MDASPRQQDFISSLIASFTQDAQRAAEAGIDTAPVEERLAAATPLIVKFRAAEQSPSAPFSKADASALIDSLKGLTASLGTLQPPTELRWAKVNGEFVVTGAADVLVTGAVVEVTAKSGKVSTVVVDRVVRTEGATAWAATRPSDAATKTTAPEGVHVVDGTYYKVQQSSSGNLYAKIYDGDSWSYVGRGPLGKLSESTLVDAETAAAFGHLYGSCVFCARHLSDERSIAVGYGPDCADNNGLPWG
jgi:hypothetical protein